MLSKTCLTLLFLTAFAATSLAAESPGKEAVVAPAKDAAPFSAVVSGAGRPMILIPGLGCGGNVWDGTVAHFQGSYQIHTLTLAGFAGQKAIDGPFLEKVRDGLAAYIREQKLDHPLIIGHSLGGFLAYWLGAEFPDLVGPIIAVDGVPYFPALRDATATPESQKALATMFRNSLKNQTPAQYAFSNRFTLAGMITNPQNIEKVAAQSDKSDPAAVGQALYEILTLDLRDKLKSIQSPVVLIAAISEENKKEEESYQAQVANIPRHKVVFARQSKHFVQLDQPEFLYETITSFLGEAGGKDSK